MLDRLVDALKRTFPSHCYEHLEDPGAHAHAGECHTQRLEELAGCYASLLGEAAQSPLELFLAPLGNRLQSITSL